MGGSQPAVESARQPPRAGLAELKLSPQTYSEALSQGDQARDAGLRAKALWRYLRANQIDPSNPLATERIAYLHLSDDPARAASIFRDILADHPEVPETLAGLGLAEYAQGDFQAAAAHLEQARVMAPERAEIAAGLGVTYDALGRYEDAQAQYHAAHALDPDDAEVLNNLGLSRLLSGAPEEAADAFRHAILFRPDDPALHNNLGLALARTGDYRSALGEFRRAGTESGALNNLGYVLFLNGEIARAIEHYERALTLAGADRLTIAENLWLAQSALSSEADQP